MAYKNYLIFDFGIILFLTLVQAMEEQQ